MFRDDLTPDLLARIESATRYPSILTYHALGERGCLREQRTALFEDEVVVTEKIDGVNTRVILLPGTEDDLPALVGSRTELLHAEGDIVWNSSVGIVDAVLPNLYRMSGLRDQIPSATSLTVLYGEVFGHGTSIKASKNYSGDGAAGFRLFDVAQIPVEVLAWPRERIAAWRDGLHQTFFNEDDIEWVSLLAGVDVVPRIAAPGPPESVFDTARWLETVISNTLTPLGETPAGPAEGVVVRSRTRDQIVKIRFADYARTERLGVSP